MKLNNIKHKAVLFTAGVATLFATSCKDILDGDVLDNYSTEGLKTYQQFQTLSGALYGGYPWASYEGKFSWCVNEGLPGVLYNVFDKEGALFKLSIGDDNTILKEGYTSLYSGVIATSNQVIHKTQDMIDGRTPYSGGMSEALAREINAEGRLFRAYAHFLATEYFGEVPLVWNTAKDIAESVTLPLVSRATLYKAIEIDLKEAEKYLPDADPTNNLRATKWAAKALLAKLYLTMASCQKPVPGNTIPFIESDVPGKYNEVVRLCTEIINNSKCKLDSHANIFSASINQFPSNETIFALYFQGGKYGEGSAYQSQMGNGPIWSPGSGWGSGKGLTYTLYKSFDDSDLRKKELCLFVGNSGQGNIYQTIEGTNVYYGVPGFNKKNQEGASGKDFLSSGAGVLNNIKKYVWGLNGTANHANGMSINRRVDVVRFSDIYFMRAEAKMALMDNNPNVPVKCSDAITDINKVLEAHGAPLLSDSVLAFCENIEAKRKRSESFNFTVNGTPVSITIPLGATMYHSTPRQDLMQELRKEFAMEGHAWLDLKRLFYRDHQAALNFMFQMDRGAQMAQSPSVTEDQWEVESGYVRKAVVNALNDSLAARFPDAGYKAGNPEEDINIYEFNLRNQWFLPIPASAKTTLNQKVEDRVDEVVRGNYPY